MGLADRMWGSLHPMAPGRPPDFRGAVQAALSSTTPTAQALGEGVAEGLDHPAGHAPVWTALLERGAG